MTNVFQSREVTTDTRGLFQVNMETSVIQKTQKHLCQHLGFDLWPLL